MGRFSQYLIVSDYDNTLTGPDGTVSAANVEAIHRFMDQGGAFTVATGRSLPSFRRRLDTVPVNAPVLVCNGAVCWDPVRRQVIFGDFLPRNWPDLADEFLRRHPRMIPELQGLECHWLLRPSPMRERWLSGEGAAYARLDRNSLPEDAVNLIFYIEEQDPYLLSPDGPDARLLAQLEREINGIDGYEAVHSAPGMLEIQHAGACKGHSARRLTQLLGRSRLICVGDALNDLSMLQEADMAFVPADCHPRLRQLGCSPAADSARGTIADVILQLEKEIR